MNEIAFLTISLIDIFLYFNLYFLNIDSKENSLLATGCRSGIIAIHKIEKEELNKPYGKYKKDNCAQLFI